MADQYKDKLPAKEKKYMIRRMRRLLMQRGMVVLLMLLQVALWILLFITGASYFRGIYQGIQVLSIVLALYVISQREPGAYKLLWVMLLLIFPILGIVFYILLKAQGGIVLYKRYVNEFEKKTEPFLFSPDGAEEAMLPATDDRNIKTLTEAGFPAYTDAALQYFPVGEDKHASLLTALKKAERYIFMEYFIIDEGDMWNELLSVLRERRQNGVEIRIMMDDIGCFLMRPRQYVKELAKEGIEVKVFNHLKPFISSAQNYRDHRKILSIDGKIAYTGGVNLADEYINRKARFGHWKDTAVKVTGHAAWSFTVMFLRMWDLNARITEDFTKYLPTDIPTGGNAIAVPYASSPMGDPLARKLYLSMFGTAKRHLYITTPYLILDDTFTDALCLAAESGVDVRIITPGIPDKRFVNILTKSYYRPLIESGVRIYEYTPGFIHAKMVVSDDAVSVGSANMDYRSLYLSFETGLYMANAEMADEIRLDFLATAEKSTEITKEDLKGKHLKKLFTLLLKIFEPLM